MEIEKINIIENLNKWNNFITDTAIQEKINCFIGHNPCLAKIFKEVFGYKEEYYFVLNKGSIVGLMPGFRIKDKYSSIPLFPVAGLYTNQENDKKNIYNFLIKELGKYEVRDTIKFAKFVNEDKLLSYLKLETEPDLQWQKLSSDKRNQIRKAYKNRLTIKQGGQEYLDEFYKIYLINMHYLGSPPLNKLLFSSLIKKYTNGIVRIFMCYYDDKPIGGSLVLSYANLLEVSWASTLREYNKLQPNMIMYWEIIKFSIENKIKFFSFGRSTRGSGTHEFKSRWGTLELQLYFNQSNYSFDIRRLKLLSTIWQKLPANLTTKFGPTIRKFTKI